MKYISVFFQDYSSDSLGCLKTLENYACTKLYIKELLNVNQKKISITLSDRYSENSNMNSKLCVALCSAI